MTTQVERGSMTIRWRATKVLGAGVVAVLLVRYVASIAMYEVGMPIWTASWMRSVQSILHRQEFEIERREPVEQARFWLARTEDLPADDPELLSGAALMLNAPHPLHQQGKLKRTLLSSHGLLSELIPPVEMDQDAIRAAEQEFETLCRGRCLELIEQATSLAPADPELWRARARLAFQSGFFGQMWDTRTEDWPDILEQAATRDPDNALYDYIAAIQLFRSSASQDFESEPTGLIIRDREMFDTAVRRLEAGVARAHLQFGSDRERRAWTFLTLLNDPQADRAEFVSLANADSQSFVLLVEIVRWQNARSGMAEIEGNPQESVRILEETVRIADQCRIRDGNSVGEFGAPFREMTYAKLEDLEERRPGTLSPDKFLTVQQRRVEANQQVADAQVRLKQLPDYKRDFDRGIETIVGRFAAHALNWLLKCLLLAGGLLCIGGILRRRGIAASLSPVSRTSLAVFWFVAATLTFALACVSTWLPYDNDSSDAATMVLGILRKKAGTLTIAFITWVRWPLEWLIAGGMLALLGGWNLIRILRRGGVEGPSAATRIATQWLAAFSRDGIRSLLALAVLLGLFHLAFLPTLIAKTKSHHDRLSVWISNAQVRWAAWDAAKPP